MAIDSEVKRKSAATVGAIWNGPSVVPNSTIDQADRQHIGWSYSGITADEPGGGGFSIINDMGIHSVLFGGRVAR